MLWVTDEATTPGQARVGTGEGAAGCGQWAAVLLLVPRLQQRPARQAAWFGKRVCEDGGGKEEMRTTLAGDASMWCMAGHGGCVCSRHCRPVPTCKLRTAVLQYCVLLLCIWCVQVGPGSTSGQLLSHTVVTVRLAEQCSSRRSLQAGSWYTCKAIALCLRKHK